MKLSVIGIGNMGRAVALGLLAAGHEVTVHNRTKERALALASAGVNVAETLSDAILASDYIILVVSNGEALNSILSVRETRRAMQGKSLITLSMLMPAEFTSIMEDIKSCGGRLSDGQVMSGPAEVENRQSEFLLACAEQDKEAWQRIFGSLSLRTYDLGVPGNAAKAQSALSLCYVFVPTCIAFAAAAFAKLDLPIEVLQSLMTHNPSLTLPGAATFVQEMRDRRYRAGLTTVDSAVATLDHLLLVCGALSFDPAPFRTLRDLYARAAALGHRTDELTAVYEALNPAVKHAPD